MALYKKRYEGRAYLPAEYQKRVSALARKYCEKYRIGSREMRKAVIASTAYAGDQQLKIFGT